MEILNKSRFIIQHDHNDTDLILDKDMNPLCYVKRQQSWQTTEMTSWLEKIPVLNKLKKVLISRHQTRINNLQFNAVDQSSLGEIHENPVVQGIKMIRKWGVYSSEGEYKGAVRERMKAIGSDWVLEDSEGGIIAMSKGKRKDHDYQVIALDKQVIARCQPGEAVDGKDSYTVDIQGSDFDPLLILSYILVLGYASSWRVTRTI